MDENRPDPMEALRAKYPNMRPVKKAPTLYRMNGIGVTVFGKRDVDTETGTYVKTYCICLLFIPIIALGAYRVADAGNGGWYFLGKERLSYFARMWNVFFLAALVFFGGGLSLKSYYTGPEYQAKRQLKQAAGFLAAGDHLKAATTYRRLIDGEYATAEARQGFQQALGPCLASNSPDTVAKGLRLLMRLPGTPPVPDAVERGIAQAEKFRGADPEGALEIVRACESLAPKNEQLRPMELALLKEVVAKNPDNVDRVVELAVVYEDNKQVEESHKLLTPHRKKLGSTEGARILGQHLLQQGEYNDAYGLLNPYVQARLERLRGVEQAYTNAYAHAIQRGYNALNNQQAPREFYSRYQSASKAEQETMVETFMQGWLDRDTGYRSALANLTAANKIVPVTLDLGIVQVNRAQNLPDAQARKAELEAAERTFLAIRGLAGETDEYRLFLGEVYYWLGKSKEGKQLFDELLAAHKRAPQILLALATKLRMVGEIPQSRELSEEAYRTAKSDKDRYAAAALRAHTEVDNDDQIAWLSKADPNESSIQIGLNSARGEKALEDENKELAAQFLRKATAAYENVPKNSTSLNNCGLVYLNLYRASGDPQDRQRGLSRLEEAVSIEPGNSLLLINTMHILLSQALMDIVGDAIHLPALGEEAGFSTLSHLYNSEQQRREIYQRLRENPSMKKALSYLDRGLLLAPKRLDLYFTSLHVHGSFRDAAEIQKLQQRVRSAAPDRADSEKHYMEVYSGAKDKENAERARKHIERLQRLFEKPGVANHAPTKVYLQCLLNEELLEAWSYGVDPDAEDLVQRASAAFDASRCSATRVTLAAALFYRASQQLARQNPEFNTLLQRTRRGLSARYVITWLLDHRGPMADALRNHADIQKAVGLEKEAQKLFTSHTDFEDWALLRGVGAEQAEGAAAFLKSDVGTQVREDLMFELTPLRPSTVLEHYWRLRLLGDEKQAADVYQQALRKNLPLPPI
jgi:tetratricopeptide (TPR) repeat protein